MAFIGGNDLEDSFSILEYANNIKEEPEVMFDEDGAESHVLEDEEEISEWTDNIKEEPELILDEDEADNNVSVCCSAIIFSGGVVRWCIQRGLIAKERTCSKCSQPMKLTQRSNLSDGVQWVCNMKHLSASIRQKSWFAGSRLKMGDILKVTFLWVKKCSNAFICEELKLSNNTVVIWCRYCREVCVKDCLTNGDVLGGEGSIIEIMEAKLSKQKFGKGDPLKGTSVFAGVERGSNKCFFEVAPTTTKHVFLNVLKKYVLPGTTVISDCFLSYDCQSDQEFIQLSTERKITFKVPVRSNKTNSAEGTWINIIHCFRGSKKCMGSCDSHLFEYMWRRRWSGERDLFIAFLEAVRRVYNPE